MELTSPVKAVPFIGVKYTNKLTKLGIETIRDLIYHFPHRYQDFALVSNINQAQPGEVVTVNGQILAIKNIYTRNGKKIQTATVSDGEDKIDVTWFNQPYLVRTLPPGTYVSLSGKVDLYGAKRTMISPEYEKFLQGDPLQKQIHTGGLVPVYPE